MTQMHKHKAADDQNNFEEREFDSLFVELTFEEVIE
jgi:hypothetical protein